MKQQWLKSLLIILIFASISITSYFVLKALGFTSMEKIKSLIESAHYWSRIVFVLMASILFVLLCFVPLVNTTFVIVSLILFGPVETLTLCLISNFISSSILFLLGSKVGNKLIAKLIGAEQLNNIQNRFRTKSHLYLPILYIVPAIPDECLALIAGMTKMKYWYFITVCLIYHALELGIFCFFGGGIIDWASLRPIDWVIIFNLLIIDIVLIKRLENYIDNKK